MKQDRIILTGGLVAILFTAAMTCAYAEDTSKDVKIADGLYSEAEKNYNKGNCSRQTRDAADNALTLYNRANYEEGRTKAANLLEKIRTCIKTNADKNYDVADKAYRESKYNQSIMLALEAKEDYEAIRDTTGVEKCDALIKDAAAKTREIMINTAKGILQQAMNLFDSGDYINSEEKAMQARQLYNVTDYAEGILQSSTLLKAIGDKRVMIRANADDARRKAGETLRKAKNTQNFDDFVEAKNLAKQAQGLYRQIRDTQSYRDCAEIIADCDAQMEGLEEKQKKKADDKYAECRSDFLSGNGESEEARKRIFYANATSKCEVAKTLYTTLWGWARDAYNTKKQELYEGEISKCKLKIEEIQKAIDDIVTKARANEQYKLAYAFYTGGECRNASTTALEAKALYERIGDSGVYKTISLIDEVQICLDKLAQADAYVQKMLVYYKAADYVNATVELQKAEKLYTEVNNKDGMNRCTLLKQKIIESLQLKKQADGLIAQGVIDFNNYKFEDAQNKAVEAIKIYNSINYNPGKLVGASLVKNITEAKEKLEVDAWKNMLIIAGAIVLGIVMVVVLWVLRKAERAKSEREKIQKERKRLEEEERRKREGEQRREEQRLKELETERNKLKSMVAEEMKRIELEKRRNL